MTFKTEFAVDMTCQGCVTTVENVLKTTNGVERFTIDLPKKSVIVEGPAPPSKVTTLLRQTGKTVIVRGQSSTEIANPEAAVCILHDTVFLRDHQSVDPGKRHGLVRMVQINSTQCAIDITVSGLTPGKHGVHIHSLGDISRGAESTGVHYNPTNVAHGDHQHGHVGDLGNIVVDATGWGDLLVESDRIRISDLIGRSMVVTQFEDDLGRNEQSAQSTVNGNSGPGVLCGIIARSAGAFQNKKQICECSGKTLWEEARDMEAGHA
ncbi:copper chaperone [Dispira simplex]|nr:copper chaperone [Dispira simplex]